MLLMVLLSQTLQVMTDAEQNAKHRHSYQEHLYRRKSESFADKQSYLNDFAKLSLREGNHKKSSKHNQFLVFLQSSDDRKVLVPYIYRKIVIKEKLYFIVLSEVCVEDMITNVNNL